MRIFLFAICLFTFSSVALSDNQQPVSSIKYKQSFFGTKYFTADAPDKILRRKTLKQLLQSNPEALAAFNKSTTPHYLSQGFAMLGGAMIGASLGTAAASDEGLNKGLIASGFGVLTVGILFDQSAQKRIRASVDLYNSSLLSLSQSAPSLRRVKPQFFLTSNRVGVSLLF